MAYYITSRMAQITKPYDERFESYIALFTAMCNLPICDWAYDNRACGHLIWGACNPRNSGITE